MSGIRKRLTYANVVASLALFIALGGSSYAAVQLRKDSVRSKHIKNGQVKTADIGTNAVTSKKVKDGSLLKADFAAGQLPAAGAQGPVGPQGPKGDTGTVDTSNFYDKAASDDRFLRASGRAVDADLLDGRNSTAFVSQVLTTTVTSDPSSIAAHTCLEGVLRLPENPGGPVLALADFGPEFVVQGGTAFFAALDLIPGYVATYKVCNISGGPVNPPSRTVTIVVLGR